MVAHHNELEAHPWRRLLGTIGVIVDFASCPLFVQLYQETVVDNIYLCVNKEALNRTNNIGNNHGENPQNPLLNILP